MKSILSPPFHALSSPNLLTAAVQSRIKSLDPVEPLMHASQKMSGFQLEFLRQISGQSSTSILKTTKLHPQDLNKKQECTPKDVEKKSDVKASTYGHEADNAPVPPPSIKPCFVQLEAMKLCKEHQD